MREVVILGSTGSIGSQAIDVVSARPERFRVVGLAAGGSSVDRLLEQARALRPSVLAVSDPAAADRVAAELHGRGVAAPDAATRLAALECDVVLNASRGAAGLSRRSPRSGSAPASPWPTRSPW